MGAAGPPPILPQVYVPPGTSTAWSFSFTYPGGGNFPSGNYLFEATAPAEGSTSTIITVP
jgi:hypothetical protein